MRELLTSLILGVLTIITCCFAAAVEKNEVKDKLLENIKENKDSAIETLTVYYKDVNNQECI